MLKLLKNRALTVMLSIGAIVPLMVMMAAPASAVEAGAGAGVGFYLADDAVQSGSGGLLGLCRKDNGGTFVINNAGSYTAGLAGAPNTEAYVGPTTMTVNVTSRFYNAPEGTYYSPPPTNTCVPPSGPNNLGNFGPAGPIPISATVSRPPVASALGNVTCSGSGHFWRVGTHVHIQFAGNCTVDGPDPGSAVTAPVTHIVEGEQVPASLPEGIADDMVGACGPVTPPAECPADPFVGAYTAIL